MLEKNRIDGELIGWEDVEATDDTVADCGCLAGLYLSASLVAEATGFVLNSDASLL